TSLQVSEVIDELSKHTNDLQVIDPAEMFLDIELHAGEMSFMIRPYSQIFKIPLPGRHQLGNIALAIRAAEVFLERELKADEIHKAFSLLEWKGRFERISKDPDIIFDVAHNPESIHTFCKTTGEIYADKKCYVVLGLLKDKSPEEVLMELEILAEKIWIAPVQSHRSISPKELKDLASRFPRVNVSESICTACDLAYREMNENSVLCIIGSHYIAEEVYSWKDAMKAEIK
ncbi:MAG: cyanophycin synthetase, partial [Candidatus Marinimicrobia bacterium]|nr:cyanophycin synthetase [Candidatus Neomarinimicrobiota bacterium]